MIPSRLMRILLRFNVDVFHCYWFPINSESLYRRTMLRIPYHYDVFRVVGSLSICVPLTGVAGSATVAVYLRLYTIMFF